MPLPRTVKVIAAPIAARTTSPLNAERQVYARPANTPAPTSAYVPVRTLRNHSELVWSGFTAAHLLAGCITETGGVRAECTSLRLPSAAGEHCIEAVRKRKERGSQSQLAPMPRTGRLHTVNHKEDAMAETPVQISFEDFCKVNLRVGKVVEAADHPNADKLIVMQVDLGDERRQIVAGLKGYYAADQLVGRNIVVVTNLAPRMMRGQESQGMLLAASTPDHSQVILLTTAEDIAPGSGVS
jgi:methionine--tRNA ligase beta chain